MRLETDAGAVVPAAIESVRSSFFADPLRFPKGSVQLDSALLMRNVPVTWRAGARGSYRASESV